MAYDNKLNSTLAMTEKQSQVSTQLNAAFSSLEQLRNSIADLEMKLSPISTPPISKPDSPKAPTNLVQVALKISDLADGIMSCADRISEMRGRVEI